MKKILLSGILLILSFALVAQQNNFKQVTKKQTGGVPDIKISRVNKSKPSGKGEQSDFKISGNLQFPSFTLKKEGIRKIITSNDSPVFIERKTSEAKGSLLPEEDRFYAFFEDIKLTTKISNPRESFAISGIRRDEYGINHVDGVQKYKGIQVYGSEFSLHFSPENERFTGRIISYRSGN